MAFDLDDDELRATRRMNGSDKSVGSIEKLIEELTKVRPDELSKDGLKLFKYINEIIDRNKELEEENEKYIVQLTDEQYRKLVDNIRNDVNKEWKSLVKEKIEELETKMEYENNEKVLIWLHKQRSVLQELLEGE